MILILNLKRNWIVVKHSPAKLWGCFSTLRHKVIQQHTPDPPTLSFTLVERRQLAEVQSQHQNREKDDLSGSLCGEFACAPISVLSRFFGFLTQPKNMYVRRIANSNLSVAACASVNGHLSFYEAPQRTRTPTSLSTGGNGFGKWKDGWFKELWTWHGCWCQTGCVFTIFWFTWTLKNNFRDYREWREKGNIYSKQQLPWQKCLESL